MSYLKLFADLKPLTEFKGSISDFLKFTGDFKKLEKITLVNVKQHSVLELKNRVNQLINKIPELVNLQSFKLESFHYYQDEETFNDLFKALPVDLNSLELPHFLVDSADKVDKIAALFSTFPKGLKSLDLSNNNLLCYIVPLFEKNSHATPFSNLPPELVNLNLSENTLEVTSNDRSGYQIRPTCAVNNTLSQLRERKINVLLTTVADLGEQNEIEFKF